MTDTINEIKSEIQEIDANAAIDDIVNPQPVQEQVAETAKTIAAEIARPNPNVTRIILSVIALILSGLGTFFGIYFGTGGHVHVGSGSKA